MWKGKHNLAVKALIVKMTNLDAVKKLSQIHIYQDRQMHFYFSSTRKWKCCYLKLLHYSTPALTPAFKKGKSWFRPPSHSNQQTIFHDSNNTGLKLQPIIKSNFPFYFSKKLIFLSLSFCQYLWHTRNHWFAYEFTVETC